MSWISTHVLDTVRGCPAEGVAVSLSLAGNEDWVPQGRGKTGADGRINDLSPGDAALPAGTYRLSFELADYHRRHQQPVFYPVAEIVFRVEDATQHYHIPLLLSPFGYSTYRGS